MSQNKRNYKATFILDNRGKEDSVDQIIDGVKKEISAVQGEVTNVENFGRHARVEFTDDWIEDAARRDLTMNALSCTPDGAMFLITNHRAGTTATLGILRGGVAQTVKLTLD